MPPRLRITALQQARNKRKKEKVVNSSGTRTEELMTVIWKAEQGIRGQTVSRGTKGMANTKPNSLSYLPVLLFAIVIGPFLP